MEEPNRKTERNHPYVPALRHAWLTRYYDLVIAATTREKLFRTRLLEQAALESDDKVLDLACGTGTMAAMIKSRYPGTSVAGLDGDPEILAMARGKARRAELEIEFSEGLSFNMPYPPDEFDVVFSSLFFHHLVTEDKERTLAEVARVLKPGGKFHVCDWGAPSNFLLKMSFLLVRVLDGFETTRANVEGRLPGLVSGAGFERVLMHKNVSTILGTLNLISARKPSDKTIADRQSHAAQPA